MMLTGIRVKITRHRLEVLRKGLLTEQATMKSLCFVSSHRMLRTGKMAAVGTWRRASITVETKKYKCTRKTVRSATDLCVTHGARTRRTRP